MAVRRALAAVVRSQQWLCLQFDRIFPKEWRVDGRARFQSTLVRQHIGQQVTVYDVGGGRHPFFSAEEKRELGLRVVGLDISAAELRAAPAGCYDEIFFADITEFYGRGDADAVICQAVLEHVRNTDRALASIASVLKCGGKAVLFVPCRTALFARLNLLLPEDLKRKLLFTLFPQSQTSQGFLSYYDRCTPEEFEVMADSHGLKCEQLHRFYKSAYFSFLFPLYVAWRAWTLLARLVCGDRHCETFSMILRKAHT